MLFGVLRQIHPAQRRQGRFLRGVAAQPGLRQHTVGKELEVYVLHDEKGQLFPLLSAGGPSVPEDCPGSLLHQPAQTTGQGALPRPVAAGDGGDLPPGRGEGNILPHRLPTVPDPEALDRQTIFGCARYGLRLRQGHLRQAAQSQLPPLFLGQGQELRPGESPLQLPLPKVEHPVGQVCHIPQAVLRHQHGLPCRLQPF